MLTQNQQVDLWQQNFGRPPTPNEQQNMSGIDLTKVTGLPDPTFALVPGQNGAPSTVYDKTTGKAFSTPQEFAKAAGLDPNNLDWSKLKLDTAWQPSQQPYSAPQSSGNGGSGTFDPTVPFDANKAYQDAWTQLGGNDAQTRYQKALDQLNQIDTTLAGAKQQKLQEAKSSGGLVNEGQIDQEVAQEHQDLYLQRDSAARELQTAQQMYGQIVGQARTQAQLAQSSYNSNLAAYRATTANQISLEKLGQTGKYQDANTAAKALTQYVNAIKNGTLDPSTLDPKDLAAIDQAMGLPEGTTAGILGVPTTAPGSSSTTPQSAAAVNNPMGIKPNGQFSQFNSPQDGYQAGVQLINQYLQGAHGINSDSTLEQFVNTWINGNQNRKSGQGYTADDVANYLKNTIGIKNVSKNTPLYQLGGADNLAQAVAHFETGYDATTGQFPGGSNINQITQSLTTGPKQGGYDQGALYNAAIYDMLGVPTTSIGGMGSATARRYIANKENQIMQAYGLTPFDVATAKAEYKGLTAANTKMISAATFTKAYTQTATENLNLALQQSKLVPRSGAKLVNQYKQWAQGNFTPAGPLAKLETYIYTAAREYAKVTSGGAQSAQGLTDSAQQEADKLLNAAQSPDAFQSVVQAMKDDMANVNANYDNSISQFAPNVSKLLGIAGSSSGSSSQSSQTSSDSSNPLGL